MKRILLISLLAILPTLTYGETAKSKPQARKKSSQEVKPSISFKPDSMVREYAPGSTVTEKIIIQNNLAVEYNAQVLVVPAFTNASGAILRQDQLKKNAKDTKNLPFLNENIIISEKTVVLKPNQVTTVPVTFKIPADAKGTYYFQYSVQPINKEFLKIKKELLKQRSIKGAQMMVALNVFSIGAIKIKDKADLLIEANNSLKYISASKQVLIQSILKNKGTDFAIRYEGVAVILKNGQVVSKFDLKPTQGLSLLLPETQQSFAGAAEAPLVKGDYDVVITFKDNKGEKLSTFKEKLKVN